MEASADLQLVYDLYVVLRHAYESEYRHVDLGRPWAEVGGNPPLPIYLKRLLPQIGGYVYAPDTIAPIPIAQYGHWMTDGNLRVRSGIVSFPPIPRLADLQATIVDRAWAYGLMRRAQQLLTEAIKEADQRVAEAEAESNYVRPMPWYGYPCRQLSSDNGDSDDATDPPNIVRLDLGAPIATLHLERTRRHWLLLWQAADKARISQARGRYGDIRIKEGNWEALITTDDLDAAAAATEAYLTGPGRDRYWAEARNDLSRNISMECLHAWYVQTLWLCGASWQDLHRVLIDPDPLPRTRSRHVRWTKRFYDKVEHISTTR